MPIVEPEVTLGPGDYDIETTAFWSERVYSHVFRCGAAASYGVRQMPLWPWAVRPSEPVALSVSEDGPQLPVIMPVVAYSSFAPGSHSKVCKDPSHEHRLFCAGCLMSTMWCWTPSC